MKKLYFLPFILSVLLLTKAQAQDAKVGLKAGLNIAVVNNTINEGAEPKLAPHFGVYLEVKGSDKVAFQPELVFSQQGYTTHDVRGDYTGKVNLSYFNVPMLLKVYMVKGFHFTLGPQIGILMNAKSIQKTSSSGSAKEFDINDKVKPADLSLSGGLGYIFNGGFNLGIRYNAGLTNLNNDAEYEKIRDQVGAGKMTNRVIQLSLGYSF